MKVLVLGGGNSPEREVSLRSAKSVANAAREAGFEVTEADPKDGFTIFDSLDTDTIVFPILHGAGGEDGEIQKDLEKRRIAYLGSDSQSSAECFDKWLTRRRLESNNVQMPKAVLVSKETYKDQPLANQPHVLKVLRGGSSIGTLLVKDPSKTKTEQIDAIFKLDTNAVIEEFIDGIEATVPILDKSAMPVIEIIPPTGEEFDYENKYNGRTQELCPPRSITDNIQKKCREIAERVHQVMACRHLSRVDIMIDKQGSLYVLEINTMPGMTDQSLYPKSAAVAGITMPKLVQKFAQMVERDYNL